MDTRILADIADLASEDRPHPTLELRPLGMFWSPGSRLIAPATATWNRNPEPATAHSSPTPLLRCALSSPKRSPAAIVPQPVGTGSACWGEGGVRYSDTRARDVLSWIGTTTVRIIRRRRTLWLRFA